MRFRMVLFFCAIFLLWGGEEAAAFDLQSEIDRARDGDVISIPAGEHQGPVMINKPLVLQGDRDAVLINESNESTLIIQSDQVVVRGLTIVHQHKQLDIPAVSITGDGNTLADLQIETGGMGIVLSDANDNMLRDITIEGALAQRAASGSMSAREGNGIDLFRSHENVIERVRISGVQDGVYIERGRGNIVREAIVSESRYGFHLMFSEQSRLEHNESFGNITGAMVMGTQGTVLDNNHFYKQSTHVFSQGLMLYDVRGATVSNNIIEQNLVGLYMESAFENEIVHNQINHNYIGLDVNRSEGNKLQRNQLIGNMISARAAQSTDNEIRHNYWEDNYGLDLSGDRVSELPFYADLIFPVIMNSKSIYQIFADSPGMMFLQLVLDVDRKAALADTAPLMELEGRNGAAASERNKVDIFIYGFALLISMFVIITMGGRKSWLKPKM